MNLEKKNLVSSSLDDLGEIALKILEFGKGCNIFAFYGDLGAGKTTLIREICRILGVTGEINSPTFSIVNEYEIPGEIIYHFDFYRIKNEGELYDMGYEEYFFSGHQCLIEWPEKTGSLLPQAGIIKIRINVLDSGYREFRLERN